MMEIKPRPNHLQLGEKLGEIRSLDIKGKTEHWQGYLIPSVFPQEGNVEVELFLEACPDETLFQYAFQFLINEEGYYFEIKKSNDDRILVWVLAKSPRGYYYAYLTWSQMIQQTLYECSIVDNPSMKIRGIVEGYYGKPWSYESRVRAFKTLSREKINTYVYAPKNDRYHRDLWAVAYPSAEEQELKMLIEECHRYQLDFVFAVSPGLSIRYTSLDDIDQLMAKFKQVYQHGVRFFGLFFDDIAMTVHHVEDRSRFGDLVSAQIHFILSVFAQLKRMDANIRLMICPTLYSGEGTEEYISRLGRAMPAEIDLLWTGRRICSPEITTREARAFYESTRHRTLYWDNYPVNDANMLDEIHLGPLINRDPLLYLYSSGLIANVMEYAEASLIPLITVAHYLWNPEVYDPKDSHAYAVREIVGEKNCEAFLVLSDCINQSSLTPLPGNEFMMKWFTFHSSWGERNTQKQFYAFLLDLKEKAEALLQMENVRLQNELRPWIKQAIRDFDYLLKVLSFTEVTDPTQRNQLVTELKEWTTTRKVERPKALGFFPQLIASEILEKE